MSYETNDKMVSHPDHYKSGKYEVIDIIDEFTKDLSGTEAVCTANAIKYILRWKKKNGIQDVKKAIWYLQHMVDKEEDVEVLTCKECGYYNPVCCFTGNNVKPDQLMCACFEEKGKETEVLVPDIDKVKEFYDIAGKPVDSEPKEVNMDKIMNRPTNEEIHSCDDCRFKVYAPDHIPCKSCDLHLNPPSNWISEDI